MLLEDYEQAIYCTQKIMLIERETSMLSCNSLIDFNPTESLLFIAEAFYKLKDYRSSNEWLYKVLENISDLCTSVEE